MFDRLLILGASARAAAASATRAGLTPSAIDLFCDDDLVASPVKRSVEYPSDLPTLARGCPPSAWMYTGALENTPHIIDRIATERACWGTRGCTVRRIRDPWVLSKCLQQEGLFFPEVIRTERRIPGTRWIRKPYASAGGGNMQLLPDSTAASQRTEPTNIGGSGPPGTYLQQFIDGESQSAVFVAALGQAVLLGVTQQLIGTSWTGATGFRYAGSIGPIKPSAEHRSQWCRIGSCLANKFSLQGLFGVDAIVNDQDIWTVEVNPRYTSSIELLEYGLDLNAVADHVEACRGGALNDRSALPRGRFRGKAILYASRDVQTNDAMVKAARQANAGQDWPLIADIPGANQIIAKGHPVATAFASCGRLSDVAPRLRDTVEAWRTAWKL